MVKYDGLNLKSDAFCSARSFEVVLCFPFISEWASTKCNRNSLRPFVSFWNDLQP